MKSDETRATEEDLRGLLREREISEVRIARLTQLYAALSQCNQAIVRSASVEELLPKICRAVVQCGGMKMAWIGLLDEVNGMVRPVAAFGAGLEYLEGIVISLNADEPAGQGPMGVAIRENKPFWCYDFQSDPRTAYWHQQARLYGWMSVASLPICKSGKPIGALAVYNDKAEAFDDEMCKLLVEMAYDISFALENFVREAEHKLAEEALRKSETLYRSLFENMLNGFAYCQMIFEDEKPADFIYLAVNAAFESHTGLKDVVGKKVSEVIPGIREADPQLLAIYGRVAMTAQPERFEMFVEALKMWFSISVYCPAHGYFVAVFDVITERKRTDAALRESELRLRTLFDQAPVGIGISRHGIGVDANKKLLEIFGLQSIEDIFGRPVSEYFAPAFQDESRERIRRRSLGLPTPSEFETIGLRADGLMFPVHVAVAQCELADGTVEMAFMTDITERKQMEAKLFQTQRMESLGRLAAGVAHDLNNIITPIIMSADMLHGEDVPEIRESLISTIEECAKRGADVVNQVLTFARGVKGQRSKVRLNFLVNEVERVARETFPRNISIASSIPSDLWPVSVDSTQIHQVLLNLCINARDAMPEGGVLRILGENVEIDENFAAMVPDAKAGDYAMLEVSDSGTGIPREIIDKIFDPFFTTKELGKGTGLGLSTVIGIARSHGGFVTVKSKEGHGSAFRVFLPIETTEVPEQKSPDCNEMLRGKGETILVVDDEANVGNTTAQALVKWDYKALVAAGGAEALVLYMEHASKIEVVLTDVMMPGMDGMELVKALKAINPRVKIIASTGHATQTRLEELQTFGVRAILEKPYDTRELLSTLYEAIHET